MSSLPTSVSDDTSTDILTKLHPPASEDVSKPLPSKDDKSLSLNPSKQPTVNRFLENDSSSSSDDAYSQGIGVSAKPLPKTRKKQLTFASSSSSSDTDEMMLSRSSRKRHPPLKSRGDAVRVKSYIDEEETTCSTTKSSDNIDGIQFTRHHSPLDITFHASAPNSALESLYYKAANTSAAAYKMGLSPSPNGLSTTSQMSDNTSVSYQDVTGQQLAVNTNMMMIHGLKHHVTTISTPINASAGAVRSPSFTQSPKSVSQFNESYCSMTNVGLPCASSTSDPCIQDEKSSLEDRNGSYVTKKQNHVSLEGATTNCDNELKRASPEALSPMRPHIDGDQRTNNTSEDYFAVGNNIGGSFTVFSQLSSPKVGDVAAVGGAVGLGTGANASQHVDPQVEIILGSKVVPTTNATPADLRNRTSSATHLTMEYGDTYIGQVSKLDYHSKAQHGSSSGSKKSEMNVTIEVPHGYGTLQSSTGQHCYVGSFRYSQREGWGKLATNRFVLWGKWKSNRLDTTTSTRIDFINGDRYCGYISVMTDETKMNQLLIFSDPKTSTRQRNQYRDLNFSSPMSHFSCWVNSTAFEFSKWGELISSVTGVRYFGQWSHGVQDGFGTQIFPTGDRYVGMFKGGKYHGVGVFFTAKNRGTCLDCIQKAEAAIMSTEAIDHAQVTYLRDTFESITREIKKHRQKVSESLLSNEGNDSSESPYFSCETTADESSHGSSLLQLGLQNRAAANTLPPQSRNEEDTMKKLSSPVSDNANDRFEFLNCGFAMKGEPKTSKGDQAVQLSTTGLPYHSPLSALPRDGTTFDGVWQMGHYQGEGSHVILPDRTRITANWTDFLKAKEGKVFSPDLETKGRRWREHFHWEALYQSPTEVAKINALRRCAKLRHRLRCCSTKKQLKHLIQKFIAGNINIITGIKVFRRFFYAAFGTCGSMNEIGAGSSPSHKGDDGNGRPHQNNINDSIGWCRIKKTFGGCIHQGKGRPIVPEDVEMALTDIMSFLSSLRRFVEEMLEEQDEQSSSSSESDNNNKEDKEPPASLPKSEKFKEVHNSNESYEAALDAFFDLDGPTILSRALFDKILPEVYPVLMNLYANVHAAENRAVEVAFQRLHGITLDDLGVSFGRHMADEELFNPYTEAIDALKAISKATSLSDKLSCLSRWSIAIDTSTKMAQLRLSESLTMEIEGINSPNNGETRIESGSTDDLLPIHQFVLIRAAVPGIYLDSKLLQDLTGDEHLIDVTSQDNFCVTTLHACVSTVPELDIDVRDECGIVTPANIYSRRVNEALMSTVAFASTDLLNYRPLKVTLLSIMAYHESKQISNVPGSAERSPEHFDNLIRYLHSHINIPLTFTAPQHCSVKTFSYIQSWVPTVLAVLSEHADRSPVFFWWRQKHVAYQQYLHRQKLAKKARKFNTDQHPNADNTVAVSAPPLIYLPIEQFKDVAPLNVIVPLSRSTILRCLDGVSDGDYCPDAHQWQELVENSTRRELLLTQRVSGVNDTPQSFFEFTKCISSVSNEDKASSEVDEALFAKEEERLTKELQKSISSRTLPSKVFSKLELLHAWYMTLSNTQRIQFQLGRDISHVAKCLAAADITLCIRDDSAGGNGSELNSTNRWRSVIDTSGSAPRVSRIEDAEAMVALGSLIIKLVASAHDEQPSGTVAKALSTVKSPTPRECKKKDLLTGCPVESDGESEWSFQMSDDDQIEDIHCDDSNNNYSDVVNIPDGATFAFRFDNCHESSVYMGVARSMLQCDPRERL